MTVDNIIKIAKEKTEGFDFSGYTGFLAIQVSLTDSNEVFYVEIKEGKLSIEPYEYHDRQTHLMISSDHFIKLMNKTLNPVAAFTMGQLKVEGDVGKALELTKLFEKE